MALQRDARYPGRWTAPSVGHPQGAFKNRTAPGALDGSYIEQDWANDWDGFFSSLLNAAGIVPNNTVDAVGASQYYTALSQLFAAKVDATTLIKGIVQLATNAQMATGTSTSLVPSVAAVMSLFSKRIFNAAADYIRIPDVPGGLMIQFGTQNFSGAANTVITYPTPFPNANIADVCLGGGGNFIGGISRTLSSRTISGAQYPSTTAASAVTTFTWVAIGN